MALRGWHPMYEPWRLHLRGGLVVLGALSLAATLALWWYNAGRLKATLRGHDGPVYSLAFSSDGAVLATGGADGQARLWSLATLRQRAALSGHTGFITSMAFSPDDKTLATRDGHDVRLWDLASGASTALLCGNEMPEWAIRNRLISPDGRLQVETDRRPEFKTLTVLDAKSGRKFVTLNGHPDQLNDWAFEPGGALLATGGGFTDHPWPVNRAGDVRLWDARTGRLLAILDGHWGAVSRVAFSPDGKSIASASYDGTIKLWDVTGLPSR
jgi:WD40 repeat protein